MTSIGGEIKMNKKEETIKRINKKHKINYDKHIQNRDKIFKKFEDNWYWVFGSKYDELEDKNDFILEFLWFIILDETCRWEL